MRSMRWCLALVLLVATTALATEALAQGGETCATAQFIPCGDVNLATNTANRVNNYDQASACTGFESAGPDAVFRIQLVNGGSLSLTFDGPYDASIYLITNCNDPVNSCVAGSDTYPPGIPDAISYTNTTGADQTLYLIVDGFSEIDFGPGVLTGTIDCTGTPSVVGACCDRATGGCSITTNFACAASDGIFQGAGTVCSPTPCPPAETRCATPGLSVTRDALGDHNPQLGSPQLDVERVSFAEPWSGSSQLVVTLKVAELDPGNLPLNALWTVFWRNPVAGDPFPRKFVQMTTCDPLAIPSFVYGHAEPQETGGDLNVTDGEIAGSLTADGTIRLTVAPGLVGNPQPGMTLTEVSGETFVFGPGASCTGLINTIDESPTGSYRMEGNAWCRPFTVACPASFTADSTDGDIPLVFDVVNPSTASRRFTAEVSDANGWIVGGPLTRSLDLGPGETGQVTATLRMNAACEPSATDPIQLRVSASDLAPADNVRQCATTATCEVVRAGVGEASRGFSFALRSNPVRGEGTLHYHLPRAAAVRIEVFTPAGRRVARLVDRLEAAGGHTVGFATRDAGGTRLEPGVYLVRITAGAEQRSVTAVVLE